MTPATDEALTRLLLALGLLKGVITLGTAAIVAWRLRQPVTWRRASVLAVGVAAMAAGSVLLVIREAVQLVPLLFDTGAILVVLSVLTDRVWLRGLASRWPAFRALRVRQTRVASVTSRAPETHTTAARR